MGPTHHRAGGLTHALALLALLAFVLRAAIPAGYMLDQRANYPAGMVICSGFAMDQADKPDPHKDEKNDHTPCVFAMSAVFNAPAQAPSIDAPLFAVAFAATAYEALRPGLGLAAPPPWATGPPQNA